ncbi:MAG TPA: carboxypeptidase-like regulatory domain-containing protein, partial [Flavisolibacter sp.]|nr:carboxypeptidase-like regulatory domain-containing protein [Flavisolibacter sp.]
MNYRSCSIVAILLFFSAACFSQKKWATIKGRVLGENEETISNVSVTILGQQSGIATSDSGTFSLKVPADKAFALVFTYTGFRTTQQNFILNEGEEERITIRMERGGGTLEGVTVTDQRDRREAGLIRPNPKNILNLPSPIANVESMIKIIVGSNNELTSQYNVRGGSYDENLIYVNDFEIFKPYLVRSGQQEGLSFINPELVRNISFYNGGYGAKYGDKMSSVLDIQYNKPRSFGGSAYISVLEQGFHVEGITGKNKLSYLVGVRNRSNKNLLSRQETQGAYVPSSTDLQALITYQLTPKWSAELLANISETKFTFVPEFSQLTSSVFSPFFTANLGVDIYFDGQERDAYSTKMLGLSTTYQPTKSLRLKFLSSRFQNNEEENVDITGAYLFGDRDFDKSNATFGLIINPLGAGVFQNFSRNTLNIANYNLSHKGSYDGGKHILQWGLGYDRTDISDKLNEWEYQDSAGYSLPYNPNVLQLNKVIKSAANFSVNKWNGYMQNNIALGDSANTFTLQAGLRFNYNDLNNELIVAPRLGGSWKPDWKRDIIFRAALGAYHQPPFYRELRRYDGTINKNVKAQKSWQAVGGFDYNFSGKNRPFRLTLEAYYKSLTNVVPYDIDNVRLRYFGENMAKAYAAGVEMRLFGELVKDAESWLSIGLMRTRENLENDFY